jgi:hypothetical protein
MHARMRKWVGGASAAVATAWATVLDSRPAAAAQAVVHSHHLPLGLNDLQSWRDRVLAGGIVLLLLIVLSQRVLRRRRSADLAVAEHHSTFWAGGDAWRNEELQRHAAEPLPHFHPTHLVTTAAVAGWHPVQGDPTRVAYWDGERWTAMRRWDGQQWVDTPSGTN